MAYRLPTDPSQAAALARSPDLSSEQLQALATSDLPFLREAAAQHPQSSPELLASLVPKQLSDDAALRIARSLSVNPSAPAQVLAALLQILDPELLDGSRRENWRFEQLAIDILRHPTCPVESGLVVIGWASGNVRTRIAEVVDHPLFLSKVASDPSSKVSSVAKARLKSPGA